MNNEEYAIKITPTTKFNISDFPNKYLIYLNKFNDQNNFILKLISLFHDYGNLYFASKFYNGVIMNYFNKTWNENNMKFFVDCIVQCLTLLRKEHIIDKDLHFANLVLDISVL